MGLCVTAQPLFEGRASRINQTFMNMKNVNPLVYLVTFFTTSTIGHLLARTDRELFRLIGTGIGLFGVFCFVMIFITTYSYFKKRHMKKNNPAMIEAADNINHGIVQPSIKHRASIHIIWPTLLLAFVLMVTFLGYKCITTLEKKIEFEKEDSATQERMERQKLQHQRELEDTRAASEREKITIKNTTEEIGRLCRKLPHSDVAGNDLKNYIACMRDRGQAPLDSDVIDISFLNSENANNNKYDDNAIKVTKLYTQLLPSLPAHDLYCIPSKKSYCTLDGCKNMEAGIFVLLGKSEVEDSLFIARCDKKSCDKYDVSLSQSGAFTTFETKEPHGMLFRTSQLDQSYIEVVTLGTESFISNGYCYRK